MNITFLGSADSWYLRDLQRAAGDRHVIEPASFGSLTASISVSGVQIASGEPPSPLHIPPSNTLLVRTMPPGSLEQVVFRMDALSSLEATGTLVVNPPKAIEAAVDKYLTTSRLARAGLLVPRTITCQSAAAAMEAFEELGGDVVLKPLFGGEGRGITRLTDQALALRAFKLIEQLRGVLYLQQFVPHSGYDLRVLILGDKVFAMRRRNGLDWRTNISLGGRAEPHSLSDAELDMALQAAVAVGAPLAGVDLLPGTDGQLYAIEVNAVPGWRALARVTGIDIAAELLAWLEARMTA